MDAIKLLYKYLNGNVEVSIFSDGTKIQEWPDNEEPNPQYPNSIDVKITNYCNIGCPYCHEMSNVDGKHADLDYLLSKLQDLPRGTELAIGGGDPLSHVLLSLFLKRCKHLELIPNITINSKSIEKESEFINYLINDKLVYGVGISIDDDFDFKLLDLIDNVDNIVFHVIAGINDISILDKIKKSKVNKTLILGYKTVGRGISYHNNTIEKNIIKWEKGLSEYLFKSTISFDNLALIQLKIKSILPKSIWDKFFMGKDGQFTMYIDSVKKEYAVSSTSEKRFPLIESIEEAFENIKSFSNKKDTI